MTTYTSNPHSECYTAAGRIMHDGWLLGSDKLFQIFTYYSILRFSPPAPIILLKVPIILKDSLIK